MCSINQNDDQLANVMLTVDINTRHTFKIFFDPATKTFSQAAEVLISHRSHKAFETDMHACVVAHLHVRSGTI